MTSLLSVKVEIVGQMSSESKWLSVKVVSVKMAVGQSGVGQETRHQNNLVRLLSLV
jgi:hypothetical protein